MEKAPNFDVFPTDEQLFAWAAERETQPDIARAIFTQATFESGLTLWDRAQRIWQDPGTLGLNAITLRSPGFTCSPDVSLAIYNYLRDNWPGAEYRLRPDPRKKATC